MESFLKSNPTFVPVKLWLQSDSSQDVTQMSDTAVVTNLVNCAQDLTLTYFVVAK